MRSREAARIRRSVEADIICDLASLLPIAKDHVEKLDKISVVKLALNYIKLRRTMAELGPLADFSSNVDTDGLELMTAMDGFFAILDQLGNAVYVSPNVLAILGLHPLEVIGANICDYVHSGDVKEFEKELDKRAASWKRMERSFECAKRTCFSILIRMKSAKQSACGLKSAHKVCTPFRTVLN